MMRYFAVVSGGVVTNVAIWDGQAECAPLEDAISIPSDLPVSPGWEYDGENFIVPPPFVPPTNLLES